MRQSCLTAALPIVSPSLCLLSCCLTNNGNGRLFLDGYFVHWQSVIQHLSRLRALSVNIRTIRMLHNWSLRIAPVHSRVGEGACLLRQKQIVWLWTTCGRNVVERRKLLKSVLCGCRATILFCITHLHARHVLCTMRMSS